MLTNKDKELLLNYSKELSVCVNEFGVIFGSIQQNNLDLSNVMDALSNSAKAISILEVSHNLIIKKLIEHSNNINDDLK